MVAVTYGVARVSAKKTAERAKPATPRKGYFARFMDALVDRASSTFTARSPSTRICCRARSMSAATGWSRPTTSTRRRSAADNSR